VDMEASPSLLLLLLLLLLRDGHAHGRGAE
jgi:hypothetical protein